MAKTKPSCPTDGNKLKNLTEKNKGKIYNHTRYRGKKTPNKDQGAEIEAEIDFKRQYSDLEGYIFDLG